VNSRVNWTNSLGRKLVLNLAQIIMLLIMLELLIHITLHMNLQWWSHFYLWLSITLYLQIKAWRRILTIYSWSYWLLF